MSDLQVQRDEGIEGILEESEILLRDFDGALVFDASFDLDQEIAAKCIRAAYAAGYHDALSQAAPFPLTEASKVEREAWAKLPV